MSGYRRTVLFLIVILVAGVTSALSALRGSEQEASYSEGQRAAQEGQQSEDESQFPAADYESPETDDPDSRAKRRKQNARHDKNFFVRKDIPPGRARESILFNDWESGLPALPASRSGVIVIGEVTGARAYLSNDKTGVYSEFTARVEEALKTDDSTKLPPGSLISLERAGGAVRYPNGHKHLYRVAGQGMPRVGRRYVFFLNVTEAGQNFRVLTAYELRSGKVFPLDDVSRHAVYQGMERDAFISAVRSAITDPPPAAPEKVRQDQ